MASSLEYLLSEGIISEVLARLKSGKEADVYVVRYGGNTVAAKVYKDRAFRSFKNNASYKEGRSVRNSRSQRAIDRGSKFGKASAEDAWKSAEADALYKLHSAGVRVPTPVMFLEGVLLMELVLDAEGAAAPRLIDTDLSPEQANQAYHDMLRQLVRILSCELIHGDLSPYNVLWSATGPTIIDFPQIISAAHNNSSETFFLRDARNILGHFAGIDRSLNARSGDAAEIWRAYARRELTPDFVPTGRQRPQFQQQRPAFDQRRSFEPRPPMGDTHPPRRPPGNPQQRPPMTEERQHHAGPAPHRQGPPQSHQQGNGDMHGQGQHRQGGNQPPRHPMNGETQGHPQGGYPSPRHPTNGEPHGQGQYRQGGNQPPRHQGNRDARHDQQGNQPRQGRPGPNPQGPRNPQPPRQDGGHPRAFTPQRRAMHVPEVIVRHRFPGPTPAVETVVESAAAAPENERTDSPAGPRRRRRNRRS